MKKMEKEQCSRVAEEYGRAIKRCGKAVGGYGRKAGGCGKAIESCGKIAGGCGKAVESCGRIAGGCGKAVESCGRIAGGYGRKAGGCDKVIGGILAAALIAGTIAGCTSGGGATGSGGALGTEAGNHTASGNDVSGSNDAASGAKGRFLESDVTLPEAADRFYCMGKREDGGIEVFARDTEEGISYLFLSEDQGESWSVLASGMELPLYDAWRVDSAVAPDGSVVVALAMLDGSGYGENVMEKISPDGTVEELPFSLPEYETGGDAVSMTGTEGTEDWPDVGNCVQQMEFDAAGRLFIKDLNGDILNVNQQTGECTVAIDPETGREAEYFGIAGEKLLAVTDAGIPVFDTADGAALSEDVVLDTFVKENPSVAWTGSENTYPAAFCAGVEEGSIAYAYSGGIFLHLDGAGIDEQLVNGEYCSLGDTTNELYSLLMPDEESFLLALQNPMDGSKLLRFQYDKDVSAIPESQLKVYTLKDSSLLRQAVAIYQKQNQEVFVQVEVGTTGEDGITAEDAVSALNTEILSGNGPDVIVLDGLPSESYIEKGLLCDISGIVEEIDGTDGLFANVKDAYERDGAIYEFPARFYPVIACGSADAVAAAATLGGYADYMEGLREDTPEGQILPNLTAEGVLWTLFHADSANWQKEDGTLDEERVTAYLEAAKRLYDIDEHGEGDHFLYEYENTLYGTASNAATFMIAKESKEAYGTMVSIYGLADVLAACDELGVEYGLLGGQGKSGFTPYLKAGISNTGNVEEAENFLRLLLGSECGSADSSGFPVNRAGFDAVCQDGLDTYGSDGQISVGGSDEEGNMFGYSMNDIDEEAIGTLTSLLEGLNAPSLTDTTVEDLVLTQGERYLTGDATLAETVTAISQKLAIYFAE